MIKERYDLVVIGSGPAGERAAVQACKLGKKVAIIERRSVVGGVCVHTGTLPSKTLRETSLYYSGLRQRSFYGFDLSLKKDVSVQELMHRKNIVVDNEVRVILDQLNRNGITIHGGRAQFVDNHHIAIYSESEQIGLLEADYVVIATGTRPYRLPELDYDGVRIFDGESIIGLKKVPETMAILGGGVIGCEWASIFARLDIEVTLIDRRQKLLSFLDAEFSEMLFNLMRRGGIKMELGHDSRRISLRDNSVEISLDDNRTIVSEVLLVTAGRLGNTGNLGLNNIGLRPSQNGLLEVDENFRTSVENIFAVGDVIGFPSLASTAMDQGRLAALAAFSGELKPHPPLLLPFGIYTIPEVSYVGETEENLKQRKQPYETGLAHFFELPRGQINNDHDGVLKLLFDCETKKLLGVHIIGERATEIIHIGQAVMAFGGTIDYFVDTVMNYPTIAEAYKTAALDGLNKLGWGKCRSDSTTTD
jgi:NAD(P) transhydrogenase